MPVNKTHKNPIKEQWSEPSQGKTKRGGQRKAKKIHTLQEPKKKKGES